jgi:flagellar biosynthesis/type III secretory pathway chaperone
MTEDEVADLLKAALDGIPVMVYRPSLFATLEQWRLDRIAARETVLSSMKSMDELKKQVQKLEDECEDWRQAHRTAAKQLI